MIKYSNVSEYIAFAPKEARAKLREIRTNIKKIAPSAKETISYGIPTYKLNGNLVHFGGYKTHIGFYPGALAIKYFKKELSKFKTSKGTVQFPLDKKLPFSIINKIVKYRVKQNLKK
jgi:uncharacterized protein YdhG (YjbR/CyaY superfamily)